MAPFGPGQGNVTATKPKSGAQATGSDGLASRSVLDPLLAAAVPQLGRLSAEDQHRLSEMARDLRARGMQETFIRASLKSTAEVMRELSGDEGRDPIFQREPVKRFIEQNQVAEGPRGQLHPRRERKREEREHLQVNVTQLLREARLSRGRHEIKKIRNMLLKLDQREVRRQLGGEGEELCRQINAWLRSTASMF